MPTLWVKFGNGRPVQVDVQESANVYHLIKAIKEELHPKLSNVSLDEIDICINPTDTNAIPRNILVTEIYYGHPERHKNTYESPLAVLANVSPYPGKPLGNLFEK